MEIAMSSTQTINEQTTKMPGAMPVDLKLERYRPGWDISSAEQRTAWAKGDKAKFYPYGKTQAQVLAEED
jgi:hypothetical protein